MISQNRILHDKLIVFLKESIPVLRKTIDITSLPTLKKYRIEKVNNRTKYVQYDNPNWWQIKPPRELYNVTSLSEVLDACQRHKRIKFLDNKWSYAFGHGTQFKANNVPWGFLQELISRENGLRFNIRTFEKVFRDFIIYIQPDYQSHARLIVPLDNLKFKPKRVDFDSISRLRQLTPKEVLQLINNHTILREFYGSGLFSQWFTSIMEFDIRFDWYWEDKSTTKDKEGILQLIKSSDQYKSLEPRINQEIVLLRAILNLPISSPTYVIDYCGWNSVMFSGGSINLLHWVRPKHPFAIQLDAIQTRKYKKLRSKFMSNRNLKEQQRIFVAMRKLAFSMGKPYGGDVIMDTVSGLEGLLVGSETESRHKFAERIALLFGRNLTERIELQKEMREAYDLRSKVAHGTEITDDLDQIRTKIYSDKQPSKKEVHKYNQIQVLRKKTRSLLHKTILVFIDRQTTHFDWDSLLLSTKRNLF